jgi:mannose-6-phosphate isomerase-like protein (cupin superfamily)
MKSSHDNGALKDLIANVEHRKILGNEAPGEDFVRPLAERGVDLYRNQDEQGGIDFKVERLVFPGIQVMDPRIVKIAPGKCNELHRHAHESVFVILSGHGEVLIGKKTVPVKKGDIAFVPRWVLHQTRNLDEAEPLAMLAITDFGFTSAILGDYDRATRLKTDQLGSW